MTQGLALSGIHAGSRHSLTQAVFLVFDIPCGMIMILPALGLLLLPWLCPLGTNCGSSRFPFSTSPQSQVPCPFHVLHLHKQHLLPVLSCLGCPTTELSPGRMSFTPPFHFPPSSTLPPPAVVPLSLCLHSSFLFCFLPLWQGLTICSILPTLLHL